MERDQLDLGGDEVGQAAAAALEARGGPAVFARPAMDRLIAITMAHRCWRNGPLEDWHGSGEPGCPDDYEMFRANIALTRALLPEVAADDFPGMRSVVTDPDREATPGTTARAFCGPAWPEIRDHADDVVAAHEAMAAELGLERWRLITAMEATVNGARWWGTPDFADQLRTSFAAHRPDVDAATVERFCELPELMDRQLWLDVVFYRL